MVKLYFYRCSRKAQHEFWQQRLAEILKKDYGINDCRITLRQGGKPALETEQMFFNVSHSRDLVVIAVADCEVGVDIEFYDRAVSERVRRYCLSSKEALEILPGDNRGFINVWTAKESYLKLYGQGLAGTMRDFSVTEDRFDGANLPPAVFWRYENGEYTVCVATEMPETVIL